MTQNLTMVCEAKLVPEKQGTKMPTGKIEAQVTTWGAREGADGRKFNYQPEGFMDWAETFAESGKPLPMFVNHSSDAIPVGEWNSFEFTDEGMSAEGRLFLNTSAGNDLYKVMQESPTMFGGVSVGAYAEDYKMVDADGNPIDDPDSDEAYFQITKGGLREVSVVMYPNNQEACVSKLEYFLSDGTADLRVLEQALRDAGVSNRNAVTAASVFKKVLEQRDAEKVTLEDAPIQRESEAEVTETAILNALEQRELLKLLDQRLKG
jgi:HK97 family phage prohead protease